MKNRSFITKLLIIALLTGVFQVSCTKLDEEVYSNLTGEVLFDDPDNLIYAFGAAYTNLYRLVGHKYGMVGHEAGTDLLVVPQRGGDWYDGGEWHRYHRHTWTPAEGYVSHWWTNIYAGVNICNKLIDQFDASGLESAEAAIAELRALRALYYFWLIDIFGNVPIVDKYDVPADYKPPTNSRQEVYDFIEGELLLGRTDDDGNEWAPVLPLLSKETGLSIYSRINYYSAYTILAKLYLNAEVYTGTPQYEKALAACDTVYNSNLFSLESDFFSNFGSDATASPEHILGVPFDQVYAAEFEIHLFTLHYSLQDHFKLQSATWNGICAQEDFFNSFEETDVRRNGLLHGEQYDDEGNLIEDPGYEKFQPGQVFDPDGPGLDLTPAVNMLEPNCLRQAGARVAKFPYIEDSDRYTGNDFPIFRFADILLMRAELLVRTSGDLGVALEMLNMVRTRALVDPLAEVTLENILAERARELYAEGHRRSDLIRFGAYLNTRWEKEEMSADYVTLWPIPEGQIDANPNLDQNPGY